ncbi:MAG TPA: hypothetical protein VLK33_01260 [Terriglobales bacterium]|nr:hypothetical protein [Terriglobales bacterium]
MSTLTAAIGSAGNIYRAGKILVVPSGSTLPLYCVKCGAPASGKPLHKTFHWHNSWLYILLLLGVFIYAVVALIIQKKMFLAIPFCDKHRSWRKRMNITGAVLLVGVLPLCIALGELDVNGGLIALIAAGMILGGAVVLALVGSSFIAVYIDETCSKFKGAGERFLATLPTSSIPGQ